MHILILGADGYLGWPTAMYFSKLGYEVTAVDNYFRRNSCRELDIELLYPIPSLQRKSKDLETNNRKKDKCNNW